MAISAAAAISSNPMYYSNNNNSHSSARKPGLINLDKITNRSSSTIPHNHVAFLALAKLAYAGSAHFLRDWIRLDHRPLLPVLLWIMTAAAGVLLAIERPWSRTGIDNWKWNKIMPYGLALAGQMYLFLWALSTLSTLRVLLLTQFANIWMVAVLASLLGKRAASQQQYAFVILGGFLASFILDLYTSPGSSPIIVASGYFAIFGSTQLSIYQRGVSKRLSSEMGGAKVLHVVAVAVAALAVAPLAFLQNMFYSGAGSSTVFTHTAPWVAYLLMGLGLLVIDFYIGQSVSVRVAPLWHVVAGWPVVFIASCFTGLLIQKSIGCNILDFLIMIVMLYGIHELLQSDAIMAESRYASEEGGLHDHNLPTHGENGGRHGHAHSHGHSDFSSGAGFTNLSMYIKAILADQDSKQIFYFLLLNLSFMFVQMLYGVWTNSLGLISDSIHMFFDCLALGVGLFASVMSKWNANKTFSYGYNRIETLSGFSNGIFLSLISIFIVFEAIERLVHPPEMNTHRLLLVSFLGFVVNMIGIFAFNHGHAHGHSHGGHDHGHGHGHDHGHGHNANMQGVFLHIMADTLGSVGVIVSTLLIDWYGWTGFDPIASMFIAVLIFLSVIPLIKDSAAILMLQVPESNLGSIEHALDQVLQLVEVSSYGCARFWPNSPESLIGSIHIQTSSTDLERVRQQVEHILLSTVSGLSQVAIQVEREGMTQCFCQSSLVVDPHSAHNHGHHPHESEKNEKHLFDQGHHHQLPPQQQQQQQQQQQHQYNHTQAFQHSHAGHGHGHHDGHFH